jgi:hypothetical protein
MFCDNSYLQTPWQPDGQSSGIFSALRGVNSLPCRRVRRRLMYILCYLTFALGRPTCSTRTHPPIRYVPIRLVSERSYGPLGAMALCTHILLVVNASLFVNPTSLSNNSSRHVLIHPATYCGADGEFHPVVGHVYPNPCVSDTLRTRAF